MTSTGYPDWMTTGRDAAGAFTVETYIDYAQEQLDRARTSEKKPPPGTQYRVRHVDD